MTDHTDLFVDEGLESIDAMNNGLLALEDDPTDEAAIDAVFRHAHTLKGNAAALGLEDISQLAHVLEDLLDGVRAGEVAIDADLMDEIFTSVDRIEAMIGELERTGTVETDAGTVVARLEAALADDAREPTEPTTPAAPVSGDGTTARIDVGDGGMPGVDATFVLQGLDGIFETVSTQPDREQVEAGGFQETFAVTVPAAPDQLASALEEIPHVAAYDIVADDSREEIDEEPDEPEPSPTSESQLSSVRVDVERLSELNELVEQLVTSRIRIVREFETADIESDAARELEKISQRLRDVTMDMQLVPFDTIARGFPRIVRDTAREVDKEIDFEMEGTDVEVDRRLLTRLKDPLIHVLRNAVDHGIESPEARRNADKPATGQVAIDVRRDRDQVVVEVRDDGGGIDIERVRQRAIDQGVVSRAEIADMSEGETYDLLFHAGFSTAEEVTDVSGRGVGMDVVRDTVTDLDGTVSIESTRGEGTTVTFRLPVTMAVADIMLVRSMDQLLGIPIADIEEVSSGEIVREVNGDPVADRQGSLSPVIDLAHVQADAIADGGAEPAPPEAKQLVIVRPEKRDVALACDEVLGQEEVVVKPLAEVLSGTPGVSGTAVLGDQQLVPIVDVVTI